MIRRKLHIVWALIFLLCTSIACEKGIKKKDNIIVFDFASLDSLFNTAVKNHEIPGATVFISFKGKEIFNRAYGFKNIENQTAMEISSIFRLASMTKPLTAVAVLQLLEQGKLKLDDPIKNYIPEFANPKILIDVLQDSSFTSIPAKNDITIRQLLTHTSGIGYGFQDQRYNALVIKNNVSEGFCQDYRTSIENIKKIASLPLLAEPGERNIYSMSYDVLGTLIEVISGLRFDKYVTKNILSPLGMNDSYFSVPKEERNRLPDVYEPTENGKGLKLTSYTDVEYPVMDKRQFFSGGADLCSTATDFNKFLLMINNQGELNGHRILGEKYVAMMLTEQAKFNDWDSSQGFGLWFVNEKGASNGLRPKGSFDSGGFFDTYSWVDPKKEFSAILLLQMYPTNAHDIHWKFQKTVYRIMNDSKMTN